MSRRRLRRRVLRTQRHTHAPKEEDAALFAPRDETVLADAERRAQPRQVGADPRVVVREATHVERLAYTRAQAAQALGLSRSTFIRRVLPYVETIDMPWGTRLVPVDELERLVGERRRPPRPRRESVYPGRPPAMAADVVERIRAARADGKSLRQIAADLNADRTPTAHGGARWWPSTVRAVLQRPT
jgi:Recombinase